MQLSHRNHSSEFKARVILEALQGEAALAELAQRHGMQASQITAEDFTRRLEAKGVQGRIGGKGRWADHVFVERLPALAASPGWPSVKFEDRYLLAYETVREALVTQVSYFSVYNARRPHQTLPYWTPDEMYFGTGEMNKVA